MFTYEKSELFDNFLLAVRIFEKVGLCVCFIIIMNVFMLVFMLSINGMFILKSVDFFIFLNLFNLFFLIIFFLGGGMPPPGAAKLYPWSGAPIIKICPLLLCYVIDPGPAQVIVARIPAGQEFW